MRTLRLVLVGIVAVLASCGGGSSSEEYEVGDTGPGGGIIVYVDKAGFSKSADDNENIGAICPTETCRYIEMAPTDLSEKTGWKGAIVALEAFSTPSATDWVLPSKDALDVIYQYAKSGVGTFLVNSNQFYWSSSEFDAKDAWAQDFSDGKQFLTDKDRDGLIKLYVRPVRAF